MKPTNAEVELIGYWAGHSLIAVVCLVVTGILMIIDGAI